MQSLNSSKSEIFYLGRAMANTMLLVAIVLASIGFPLLGLQGFVEHSPGGIDGAILHVKHAYWMLHDLGVTVFANPLYYLGYPALLLIQAIRPNMAGDRLLSRGLATDMAWIPVHALMWITFVGVFLETATHLLAPLIEVTRVGILSTMPTWLAIFIGFLIGDFLAWFSHLVRHKVTLFWFFHEVHHSQTEMNPFTPYRTHPVDDLASKAITLLPAIFFEHTLGIAFLYLAIFQLHDAFVHSNIRTNFGWLSLIFVTPEVHRIHHSVDPRYYDTNMGGALCIWDRLFGTYSPSEEVCDKTGTSDTQFPLETAAPISRLPLTIPAQLLYPYKKAIRYVLELYPWARAMGRPNPSRPA